MAKRYGTPGPRILSPDCCTSMKLAKCSMEAQLLFDRVLVTCDDQGRREGAPALVRAACFPLLDVSLADVSRWLEELHDAGLVTLYDADDQPAIQVRKWWEHQGSMRRAYPSKIQPPPGHDDEVRGVPANQLNDGKPTRAESVDSATAECGEVRRSAAKRGTLPQDDGTYRTEPNQTEPVPNQTEPKHNGARARRAWSESQASEDARALQAALSDAVDRCGDLPALEAEGLTERHAAAFDKLCRVLGGRSAAEALIGWLYGGGYRPTASFDWRTKCHSGCRLAKHVGQLEPLWRGRTRDGPRTTTDDSLAAIERVRKELGA